MSKIALPDADGEHSADMVLVFRIEGEAFAVTVDIVNEILDPQEPTPVPNADPFAPGVINVRGVVVPVVDVRSRMGMPPSAQSETARMIVLEQDVQGSLTKLAFMADAVEQVIDTDLDTLERVPDLGARWPQIFLRGAVRVGDDLIVILDPATLFAPKTHQDAA